MRDPQQELYTALKLGFESLGLAVYDVMPPESVTDEFVYMGEFRQSDAANKSAVFGSVFATIHAWSETKRRGTLSGMLLKMKQYSRQLTHTDNFAWSLRDVNERIMTDTSTKTPLLHGVLELQFTFS